GGRRGGERMEEFGVECLDPLADYICEKSRGGTLEAIRAAPRGVYTNEMRLDRHESEIELRVALSVSEDGMLADFSGSSPCSQRGINVPINYTAAYTTF